jgi:RHS repeat-associated protein
MTERDEASGLDHTWYRKYENQGGRWTSPDPFISSINLANPQSFNRYSYVENEPTNFIDPSGLFAYIPQRQQSWLEMCWLLGICGNPNSNGGSGGEEFPVGGGGGDPGTEKKKECSVPPLREITDPDALRYENGDRVNLDKLTEGTRNALRCLQNAIVSDLKAIDPNLVFNEGEGNGRGFRVNSGYRPQAYQNHLLEVWDKWQLLKNNNQKECQQLKQKVAKEMSKTDGHDLAERPSDTISNHTRGTAFDISIWGVRDSQINAYAKKCGLERGKGHGGGHHFNYVGN